MVVGMIKDAVRYHALSSRIADALKWLETADMAALQEGTNPIRGEEIFCNGKCDSKDAKSNKLDESTKLI